MSKRIISLLTVLAIMLAAFPMGAAQAEEVSAAYEVLTALGVEIDGYTADGEITRGQAAKTFAALAGLAGADTAAEYFDVAQNHEFAAYINAVSGAGIMRGTGSALFEPDRAITYAELVCALLVMMNYDVYAEAGGGYMAGYMKTAGRLKLSEGTGGLGDNTALSGAAFSQVVYNALDKKVLTVSSVGENVKYDTTEGDTLSYKYLGVRRGEGRVDATPLTAIVGGVTSGDRVKIDDKIFAQGICDGESLLGYTVEYWSRGNDDDIGELLYIAPTGDETRLTVMGYDIIGVSGSKLRYYSGDREKSVNLADDMVCVYNNEVIDYTNDDLVPADGSTEFIVNKSGRAEVCIVRDCSYGVVRSVSASGSKIIFEDMTSMRLDDFEDWRIVKNGRRLTLIELVAGDVLNIVKPRGRNAVYIEISGGRVSGKIGSVSTENKKTVAQIGDVQAVVSPSYAAYGEELRLSFEGEWYTDIFGDVFAAVKVGSGSSEYAYMISYRPLTEPEDEVKIKLFTAAGEFVYVTTNGKVLLVDSADGSTIKLTGAELYDYMKYSDLQPQLVKYSTNEDGTLRKIQFAKMNYNRPEGADINPVGSLGAGAFTLDYTSDGGSTGYYQIGIFDCSYWLDVNAPIFKIPADKNEERWYSVIARGNLTRRLYYAAELYDVNKEYEAQACVINLEGAGASYNWTTMRVALVDRNAVRYVEDEETVARVLSIYQDGKPLEIYCDDEDMTTASTVQTRYSNVKIGELKPGDVIAYSADSSNMMRDFELMFSYERERGNYFAYSNKTGVPSKIDYSAELLLGSGIVKAASANGLVVNMHDNGTDNAWNYYLALETRFTRTYLFDSDTRRWKTVPFSTVKKGDKVVIRMQGYALWEVLIYDV